MEMHDIQIGTGLPSRGQVSSVDRVMNLMCNAKCF